MTLSVEARWVLAGTVLGFVLGVLVNLLLGSTVFVP